MNVIVCGGGIAGLTAALCLRKEGFTCKVFEAKEDRESTTSAIILAPSGVRVLFDLGLSAALLEKGCAVSTLRMMDNEGRVLADLPMHNKRYYGHDSVAMTRRVLHTLLTSKCKELSIPIHYSAKLLRLQQGVDSVTAEFKNFGTVTGHVLIGADGIHSATRGAVVESQDVVAKDRRYYGFGMLAPLHYLSDEERDRLRLTETAMNLLRGPVGFVGFIGIGTPDQSGEPKFMMWSHIAAAHVDSSFNSRDLNQVKNVLHRLRGDWCQPVAKMLDLIDQARPDIEVGCMPIISIYPIPTWSNRRVVLIGDAAHGYGPGAQGAALALEDAMLLTQMLKRLDSASTEALSRCFSDFETKRRLRVERIGNAAEARNDGRLEPKGVIPATIEKYGMILIGWWYKNGFHNPENTYHVEDDLSPPMKTISVVRVWIWVLVLCILFFFGNALFSS